MSDLAMDIARLVDMLPESDQRFAHEFVKKLVLAWDPDFTKVTPEEAARIKMAEGNEFVPENEVEWNNLDSYRE